MNMSDSDDNDDMPELVASSDEDSPICKGNDDFASRWLSKPSKFLERQGDWIRVFALAPFLFAINNIVPSTWVKALIHSKLLNDKRQYELDFLSWEEWAAVDLLDESIIPPVLQHMRNQKMLVSILECVERLDECKTGVIIDVDLAVKEAEKCPEITKLWRKVLESEQSSGKEKSAKFGLLYVLKLYQLHVLSIAEKAKDYADIVKTDIKVTHNKNSAEDHKNEGNRLFNISKFTEAVDFYSKAARADPLNHIYYGNRAQGYNKLKKYDGALADGRRAVTLKKDWAKGYYRYAQAFYKLGRLEAAIQVNNKGRILCQATRDTDANVAELESQGKKFSEELIGRTTLKMPKQLEQKLNCLPDSAASFDPSREPSSSDSDAEGLHRKDKPKKKSSKDGNGQHKSATMVNGGSTERPTPPPEPVVKRRNDKEEFQVLLRNAYMAFELHINKEAMLQYQKGLDMLTNVSMENLGVDELDVVILMYAFSIAAIETKSLKCIHDGIEKLEDIIQKHQDVRFPLAHYGLGKAYITLNRFSEAVTPLENCCTIVKHISFTRTAWPGSKELIPETDIAILKKRLSDLLDLCHFPPTPDAVCRHHTDTQDPRTDIYFSDPDFKGYARSECHFGCVIDFHPNCWKDYKTQGNKVGDKEMLDLQCVTPDCVGMVIRITVCRHDSLRKKLESEKIETYRETKDKKPLMKMKSTSDSKLARKMEKKQLRKTKQREKKEEQDDLIEDIDRLIVGRQETDITIMTAGVGGATELEDKTMIDIEITPLPDVKEGIVLKKEEHVPVQSSGKQKKTKKKKEKKKVLPVEVNFSDRKEETLLGESSVLSDDEIPSTNHRTAFSVPASLHNQIQRFEKTYTGGEKKLFHPDDVTENLFSYFKDMLNVNGPMALDDPNITMELEVFPQQAHDKIRHAGGLCDFLRQSLKFAIIDDVVCLLKDAVKAREMALKRSQDRLIKGKQRTPQDAWQTVGEKNYAGNVPDGIDYSSQTATTEYYSVGSAETHSSTNFPSLPVFNKNVPPPRSGPVGEIVNNSLPRKPLIIPDPIVFRTGFKGQLDSVDDIRASPQPVAGSDQPSPGIEGMDSIDDFPLMRPQSRQKKKSKMDDIDDFEMVSETGSDGYLEGNAFSDQDSLSSNKAATPGSFQHDVRQAFYGNTETVSTSRSSSRSDISERSDGSETKPRPLRPLPVGIVGFPPLGVRQVQSPIGSEKEFLKDGSSKLSAEGLDNFSSSAGFSELGYDDAQKAGMKFVRENDEAFASEMALSVVEKMYQGKETSEWERQETLDRVRADILEDFKRSAAAGKAGQGSESVWSTAAASDNVFDKSGYMQKHYQRSYSPSVNSSSASLSTISSSISSTGTTSSQDSTVSPIVQANLSSWAQEYIPRSTIPSANVSTYNTTVEPLPLVNTPGYDMFTGLPLNLGFSRNSTSNSTLPSPLSQPSYPSPSFPTPDYSVLPPFVSLPPRIPFPSANKEVQATPPTMVTKETNTDPYEPLKEEYFRLKEERDSIYTAFCENKQFFEMQYKLKEASLKNFQLEMTHKTAQYDSDRQTWETERLKWGTERQTWETERRSYQEEIYRLHQRVTAQESETNDLQSKIVEQEKRVQEHHQMTKQQRERDLQEVQQIKSANQELNSNHHKQLERARWAEVEFMKIKLQTSVQGLEQSHKEAKFYIQQLSSFMKKCQEDNNPTPPQMLQAREYWQSVAEKSESFTSQLKREYEKQMSEINQGRELSSLSAIPSPSLPAIPDHLRPLFGGGPGKQHYHRMPHSNMMNRPENAMVTSSSMAVARTTNNFQNPPPALVASFHQTPQGAPPRPLNTPQRPPNLVPPRPLSGARAPLSAPLLRTPLPPPLAGAKGVQKGGNSYEKLLMKLQMVFPNVNKSEFPRLIQELRQERGGSLSGMTVEDIISKISELIEKITSQGRKSESPVGSSRPFAPPPGLGNTNMWMNQRGDASGSGLRGPGGVDVFQEEEDPCVICHEELTTMSTITLECTHKFHEQCIRKWLREQSTCPNCRVHALLPDEFPSLM